MNHDRAVARWLAAALVALALPWAGCSRTAPIQAAIDSRARATESDVATALVRYAPLRRQVTLVGQINPTEHGRADITTPLQGIVIQPLVHIGDRVAVGTPVAQINNVYGQTTMQLTQKIEQDRAAVVVAMSILQQAVSALGTASSTLAQAETTLSQARDNQVQGKAELVNATSDLHRKERLHHAGLFALSDVEDARERYIKAQAVVNDMKEQVRIAQRGVDIARKNLGPAAENVRLDRRSVAIARQQVMHDQVIARGARDPMGSRQTQFYVRTPISGTVIAVSMTAGLAVSPGTILASVVNLREVYVDVNAYASDLAGVQTGDPISVTADGFPDETFRGRVSYVGKQVDATTRTVVVRCRVRNPRDRLRPGLFVKAAVTPALEHRSLVVPNQAVLVDGTEHYVLVQVQKGKYQRRRIQEGIRTDALTEIVGGLKAGERVVTRGNILVVPE